MIAGIMRLLEMVTIQFSHCIGALFLTTECFFFCLHILFVGTVLCHATYNIMRYLFACCCCRFSLCFPFPFPTHSPLPFHYKRRTNNLHFLCHIVLFNLFFPLNSINFDMVHLKRMWNTEEETACSEKYMFMTTHILTMKQSTVHSFNTFFFFFSFIQYFVFFRLFSERHDIALR